MAAPEPGAGVVEEAAPLLLPPDEAISLGTCRSWRFPRRAAAAAVVGLVFVAALLALRGHRLERSEVASSRLSGATQLLGEDEGSKVSGHAAEDDGKEGSKASGDGKGDGADEGSDSTSSKGKDDGKEGAKASGDGKDDDAAEGSASTSSKGKDDGKEDAKASGDGKDDDADEGSASTSSKGKEKADVPEQSSLFPTNCTGCRQRHGAVEMPHSEAEKLLRSSESGQSGAINVSWFGKKETKYFPGGKIVKGGTGVVQVSDAGKGLNLRDASGEYTSVPLAGNSFSMDVDLGDPGASCGCNVAFFLVSMQSAKENEWGNHYCDANCIGGQCCAEFDLLEMNTRALQATSHSCSDYSTPPFSSQPWACDHGGFPHAKFGNGARNFGPGDSYTINSQKPFTFRMDFPTEHGILKGIITITQGSKEITHTMDNIENMRAPLTDGMVVCTSSWETDDLTWLDGGVCNVPEKCNERPAIFSNIVLEELPAPSVSPAPTPAPSPGPDDKCPGQGYCGCDWVEQWGCGADDGGECFCRCCCEKTGGKCKWTG